MSAPRRYRVLIWNVDTLTAESTRLCGPVALAAAVDLAYEELAAIPGDELLRLVVVVKDNETTGGVL